MLIVIRGKTHADLSDQLERKGVCSDVAARYHFGPLLFTIYINDILLQLPKYNLISSADDTPLLSFRNT